jgi:hypothetical protein
VPAAKLVRTYEEILATEFFSHGLTRIDTDKSGRLRRPD